MRSFSPGAVATIALWKSAPMRTKLHNTRSVAIITHAFRQFRNIAHLKGKVE